MIHIAICDDEKYMLDNMKKIISQFFKRKNIKIIILQFLNGEELLKYKEKIDIFFLDIQMKNKDMNGMEIARKLRNHKFQGFLIFITVLKEMVFESFEVQAYDYLVKPIEEKRFEKTMERLLLSIQDNKEAKIGRASCRERV